MLSKEQLEKRIAEIRKIASEMKWSSVEHSQVALNDAEALEELLSLREQLDVLKRLPPVGWHTEDYATDKSATTYNQEVAERWGHKGWPVAPLFTAAKPAEASRESIEVELPDQRDENFDTDTAYNEGLSVAASAIRAAGIRIKGKSE